MLCNIPSFLNKSGLIERQFLMVTLAVGGGKRGGKLSRSGLGWRGISMYFCITRVAVILAGGHGLPTHC